MYIYFRRQENVLFTYVYGIFSYKEFVFSIYFYLRKLIEHLFSHYYGFESGERVLYCRHCNIRYLF